MIVNADVVSATGNITLDAGNDLAVNAAVTTGGLERSTWLRPMI